MKVKNLFFIPFLLSSCHGTPNEAKRDDTKICGVEESIKGSFKDYKFENLQNIDFSKTALDFCQMLTSNDILEWSNFYLKNKNNFQFLCWNEVKDDAKEEFKKLVNEFVSAWLEGDKDNWPVILGKIISLLDKFEVNNFYDLLSITKGDENDKNKNIIANLLNLAVSVYCQLVYKKSFVEEVKSENSRISKLNYEKYLFSKSIKKGDSHEYFISDIYSPMLKDEIVQAVWKFYANDSLIFVNEGDKTYDFDCNWKSSDSYLRQIVILAANLDSLSQYKDFSFRKALIDILKKSGDSSSKIKENTCWEYTNILDAICDICEKIVETEDFLDAEDFALFISKIEKGSIKSSEQWNIIISAVKNEDNVDVKINNYTVLVSVLFGQQVLNNEDVVLKTLKLMQSNSLSTKQFWDFVQKIKSDKQIFTVPEISKNLFRLLNFDHLYLKSFYFAIQYVLNSCEFMSIEIDEDTSSRMLTKLKTTCTSVDARVIHLLKKYGFYEPEKLFGSKNGNKDSAIFIRDCDD